MKTIVPTRYHPWDYGVGPEAVGFLLFFFFSSPRKNPHCVILLNGSVGEVLTVLKTYESPSRLPKVSFWQMEALFRKCVGSG
jgi:hypothetical protein